MTKSMTGYGRSQQVINGLDITVEIKSVNHRYYEFSCRAPKCYGFLEEKLKAFCQRKIARGKIEVYISVLELETKVSEVILNHPLAESYIKALNELTETYNLKNDIAVSIVARYFDIFTIRKDPDNEEEIWQAIKETADIALTKIIEMREVEGERLKNDINLRCENILKSVEFIEEKSPQTAKEYEEKLTARIKDLLSDAAIDEHRILTEAAIFADKIAVAEETVRLRSHLKQMKDIMESDEAIGRKLDFIVQEINREINTIGSKAQNVEIARVVVNIKAEIEKIREQVQNIE